MGNTEWAAKSVDDPWQALAAIFEWVSLLDYGYGYESHLVVSVDGTCNGIQHLSAITRDEVAGEHVNLVPGDRPKDIYKFVAKMLQRVLERIEMHGGEPAELATYWLDLCDRELPRSLTKRQVMVLPYGGTKDSYIEYTKLWLDEHDPRLPTDTTEANSLRFKRVHFLVSHLWDAVNSTVSGGMTVMAWLKAAAKIAAKGNQPIFWTTASGFVVRHFYGVQKERKVEVLLDGSSVSLSVPVTTKDLDIRSQLRGISPNFIHSQDAAALTLCVNRVFRDGVTGFMAVHDAFGTHAADMSKLGDHLRAAFVQVHEDDVLMAFRNSCQSVMVSEMASRLGMDPLEASEKADELLPQPPAHGTLDLHGVLQSTYFFA